jgi:hypothetical protein
MAVSVELKPRQTEEGFADATSAGPLVTCVEIVLVIEQPRAVPVTLYVVPTVGHTATADIVALPGNQE